VSLDGRAIRLPAVEARRHEFLAYYKPAGEVTTRRDPEGRPIVFDTLKRPAGGRWVAIGRLDINTSGLLLLTTDGELAHRLMHPRYRIAREYAVRLADEPSVGQLRLLLTGVELEDGKARFEELKPSGGSGRNTWYHVALREGRYREVRRLFDAVGLRVSRLIRVGYGPVALGSLRRGQSRALTEAEITALYEAADLSRS
jgi:23S rRNA pseudouridine2605 synthase